MYIKVHNRWFLQKSGLMDIVYDIYIENQLKYIGMLLEDFGKFLLNEVRTYDQLELILVDGRKSKFTIEMLKDQARMGADRYFEHMKNTLPEGDERLSW
jgi:hypothetical protein